MSDTSKLTLTFGFNGTKFTRDYRMEVADSIAAAPATILSKIEAINASLSAGTSDGLNEFFRADDYDGTNGNFNKIVNAELVTTEEINIPR